MSGPFRVLVTGSRAWRDRAAVWAALDGVAAEHPGHLVVVHGAASRGADLFAAEWVRDLEYTGGMVTGEPHPADWKTHGAIAGMLRNKEMVDAGADLCVTFIARCPCPKRRGRHGTHGSVHCATAAGCGGDPRPAHPTSGAGWCGVTVHPAALVLADHQRRGFTRSAADPSVCDCGWRGALCDYPTHLAAMLQQAGLLPEIDTLRVVLGGRSETHWGNITPDGDHLPRQTITDARRTFQSRGWPVIRRLTIEGPWEPTTDWAGLLKEDT